MRTEDAAFAIDHDDDDPMEYNNVYVDKPIVYIITQHGNFQY